jgi:hypothetical protein
MYEIHDPSHGTKNVTRKSTQLLASILNPRERIPTKYRNVGKEKNNTY